tara:strand:+ start:841 stop:1605 length:765 start_codon:yes stop_codon:yes gene_type:complete
MSKYIYINNAADDAVTLPLSGLKSMRHGAADTVELEFNVEDTSGNTVVAISTAENKEKEFMEDLSTIISKGRNAMIELNDEDEVYFSNNVGATGAVVDSITHNVGPRSKVQNLTAATKSILASESGTLFRLNRAGGIVATLPVAQVGLTYDFVIETTFTGTFSLDGASANDIFTAGSTVVISDKDAPGTVSLKQFHADGSDDDKMVMDADEKGRFLGGTFTCTGVAAGGQGSATAVWHLNGVVFGDGTLATPFA